MTSWIENFTPAAASMPRYASSVALALRQTLTHNNRSILAFFHGSFKIVIGYPAPPLSSIFDHDDLLDIYKDIGVERSYETCSTDQYLLIAKIETAAIINEVSRLRIELEETTSLLHTAENEAKAQNSAIRRLTSQVHDLEDQIDALQSKFTREEKQVGTLNAQNASLEARNSKLWIINAGLRHDLTEMIVGQDEELVQEVMAVAEREEWEELSGETRMEGENGVEMERVSEGGEDVAESIAATEETSEVVDCEQWMMVNLDVGK
jgi:uncharacterized protein (DUF3084 family)